MEEQPLSPFVQEGEGVVAEEFELFLELEEEEEEEEEVVVVEEGVVLIQ